MGTLKKISFAGIDTDAALGKKHALTRMRDIQKKYPMVEWGVLLSLHWYENGPRYPDPSVLDWFASLRLNLCAHFCGQMAKDAVNNDWRIFEAFVGRNRRLFNRAQINIAPYRSYNSIIPSSLTSLDYKEFFDSICIQQAPGFFTDYEQLRKIDSSIDILIDGSGGKGIEHPFNPYPHSFVGYAGGITPKNVLRKVSDLTENSLVSDFWIDMESGIRDSDDTFDIDKVEQVLETLTTAGLITASEPENIQENTQQNT